MKSPILILLACILPGTLLAEAPSMKPEFAADQIKLRERMEEAGAEVRVFKQTGSIDLMLAIYRPEGHTSQDNRPAIVLWHGGGFKGGSPNQFQTQCRHFAARGLVAIGPQYRLRKHGATPYDAVADGASAIRWIRGHASELGIDPDRIIAGGGSAGGTISSMLATSGEFEDPADDLTVSRVPNALVLYNPVIDAVGRGMSGPDSQKMIDVFGEDADRRARISSVRAIGPHTPPALILYPELDITPLETVRRFQSAVQAHGKRCDIYLFKGQRHAFFNTGNENGRFATATTVLVDRFLSELGYLDADPTLTVDPGVDYERLARHGVHRQ